MSTRRHLLILLTGILVVGVATVVTIVLVSNGHGHSVSYRFGYDQGKDLATGTLLPGQDLSSPTAVRATCEGDFVSLAKAAELDPDATISAANKELKIRDLRRGDYVKGCVAGVNAATGLA